MKKVIFLCLLSLSLCLGKPANDQGAPAPVPPAVPVPPHPQPPLVPNVTPVVPNIAPVAPTIAPVVPHPPKVAETAPIPFPLPVPVPNPTPVPNTPMVKAEQAPGPVAPVTLKPVAPAPVPTIDNKTTEKKEVPKENAVNEASQIPPQGKAQEVPVNKTEEAPKIPVPATPVVTVKPASEPPKPAAAPKDDATVHPIEARSGFDGPSFIGGIILTLGLLAIGFMGLKYYKNQTERNYHTL